MNQAENQVKNDTDLEKTFQNSVRFLKKILNFFQVHGLTSSLESFAWVETRAWSPDNWQYQIFITPEWLLLFNKDGRFIKKLVS